MPEFMKTDPRAAMVHTKFYTHLPDPLFDLLVKKRIPRAPLLVFLVYWRAGMINGDFCAEIPIETVAERCGISTSAVTRAYQLLAQHGLLHRVDPGRDTNRPFQQAVKLTEIRLPKVFLAELKDYPNRRAATLGRLEQDLSTKEHREVKPAPSEQPETSPPDPFASLSGKARIAAQGQILSKMSKGERIRYDRAYTERRPLTEFDPGSSLSAEEQKTILQLLALLAYRPSPATSAPSRTQITVSPASKPRRLSTVEIARIRHSLQATCAAEHLDETLRQIVWSVEQGALARFAPLLASRIALKKVREGAWRRPNGMPPNWLLPLTRVSKQVSPVFVRKPEPPVFRAEAQFFRSCPPQAQAP